MAKNKNAKKTKKVPKSKEIMRDLNRENSISFKKSLIVLIAVVVFVGIVYFVTAIVQGEIKFKEEIEKHEVQYENILAGSTFKKKDKEYIVVYYDFEGNDASDIKSSISSYTSKSSAKALYKVDLSLKQNKVYTTDKKSNKKPTKATELKINGTTLIEIKDGKVKSYVEGKDKVKDYLK